MKWFIRRLSPLLIVLFATASTAADRFVTVASTTSTQNSGLFDHLLPRFTAETGIDVRVVAVGTGQALRIARNGDADVLLVHHRSGEEAFVAEGHGVKRHALMYNDFVLLAPPGDPAGVVGLDDITRALGRIAAAGAKFVSRGDDSGTHRRELALWAQAGIDVAAASGGWYRETGSGMGATLNVAAAMAGYALSDRATWLSHGQRAALAVAVEGDARLANPYGVILVNPSRHPHVKAVDGQALIDWLLSPRGQETLAAFRIDGQQLFFPGAPE